MRVLLRLNTPGHPAIPNASTLTSLPLGLPLHITALNAAGASLTGPVATVTME